MEKYKIIETIRDGTYGIVYKRTFKNKWMYVGINAKTNEYVVINKMKKKYQIGMNVFH